MINRIIFYIIVAFCTITLSAAPNKIVKTQQKLSIQYQKIHQVDESIRELLDAKTQNEQHLRSLESQLDQLEIKLEQVEKQKSQIKSLITKAATKLYQLANHRSHITFTYSKYYLNKLIHLDKDYQQILSTTQKIVQAKKNNQIEISRTLDEQQKLFKHLKHSRQAQKTAIQKLQKELLTESTQKQKVPTPSTPKKHTTDFIKQKGKLPWPLKGSIIQHFGDRITGKMQADSMLIKAEQGQSIRAIHQGWVVHAGWLPQYGFLIIIDHGDNFYSLYGHTEQILVGVGNFVHRGDAIAKAGKTGGQTQDMLYFAIKQNLKTEDPEKWLTKL